MLETSAAAQFARGEAGIYRDSDIVYEVLASLHLIKILIRWPAGARVTGLGTQLEAGVLGSGTSLDSKAGNSRHGLDWQVDDNHAKSCEANSFHPATGKVFWAIGEEGPHRAA